MDLVDFVNPYLEAFKIGSGDITWHEIIEHIASKGKPYLIATGASNNQDVDEIIDKFTKINQQICVMQCNTNYTASKDNFHFINLKYLSNLKKISKINFRFERSYLWSFNCFRCNSTWCKSCRKTFYTFK